MYQKARSVLRCWALNSGTEEDVVHDAWEAIVATEPSKIKNLEAFAVTVTWRKAIDVCRRTRSSTRSLPGEASVPSAEETYFHAFDEMRLRDAAKAAIDDGVLDARERRIFIACHLEGRTRKSVAEEEEGITPQRVGQIVATAARKLNSDARRRLDSGRDSS
jgi:RNA polymerase sigma factor (sigma-70 family)